MKNMKSLNSGVARLSAARGRPFLLLKFKRIWNQRRSCFMLI